MPDSFEKQRALEEINDFIKLLSKPDVNDFWIGIQSRKFMKEMAILQGFSTHKLKLDYQSSKLMEEIRDGVPATEAGMVTIYVPW